MQSTKHWLKRGITQRQWRDPKLALKGYLNGQKHDAMEGKGVESYATRSIAYSNVDTPLPRLKIETYFVVKTFEFLDLGYLWVEKCFVPLFVAGGEYG